MEKLLAQLVERLKKAFGERLKSVVLYGSAASGEHHANFSDLNVLCVLTEVTPRELADSNSVIRWWREQGNPSPLMLCEEEVHNSSDCFAIEFHDLKERRRVLYGEDVLEKVEIDGSFYRAQVEYELRTKLLRLRQKAAGALDDAAQLRILLADSVSTFCVLFRHAALLYGEDCPYEKRAIIACAAERFGIDGTPFTKLLDMRENKLKARELEPLPLLGNYLRQIEKVIGAVDRLQK